MVLNKLKSNCAWHTEKIPNEKKHSFSTGGDRRINFWWKVEVLLIINDIELLYYKFWWLFIIYDEKKLVDKNSLLL